MDNEEQAEKKSFFKSIWGKLSIFVLCLLLLIGGGIWYFEARKFVSTNDAFIEGFHVEISADMELRIIKLYVDEGDFVKRGQIIAELDQSILLSQKREIESKIVVLSESIEFQRILLAKLRENYEIAKREFEKEIVSFLDYDHKEKDFRMAESQLKIAEADLENGYAQLGVVEAKLGHTCLYAPRDGMIAKRWILAGDVVLPGQPMFALYDLENIWVKANLEETKLENVKIGSKVGIHVDAYPDREFKGKVFVIKSAAASQFALIPQQNATGNFTKVVQRIPIKITIEPTTDEESPYLFPGMSTEVKIRVR